MPSRTDQRRALLQRLASYVPFHAVVEATRGGLIVPGNLRLEGTIVVADLTGFTALSETLSRQGRDGIDELTSIINRVFSAVLESAVFNYHGYLVKFAGDALFTFYPGERHQAWALASVLAAQREMRRVVAALGRNLSIRVGVASGPFDLVTVATRSGRFDSFCAGETALRALAAADAAGPGEFVLDAPGQSRKAAHSDSQELNRRLIQPLPAADPFADPLANLPADRVEHAIEQLRGFVAPELYERIVESPGTSVPAERRNACAVFCEIDEWNGEAGQLAEHFEVACEAAARHGGSVNKLDLTPSGPRLLATFGIPSAHGDDERRAVAFGLELRYALQAPVRIGMESGPLFAGEVGSLLKREVTVMGDTVNVAARLAHAATPGQVLCGPECWVRVDNFVGRSTAPLPLKGKSIPVAPVAVIAPRRFTASRLERRHGMPALIGRERELEQLESIARRARLGESAAVELLGPPGIGKSALAGAVIDRWLDAGGAAFSVRCEYDRRDQPFLLFRALVSAWLGVPLDAGRDAVRAGLERAGVQDAELMAATSLFLDPGRGRLDTGAARLLAVRVIGEAARKAPLLILVEDSAHADAASSDLLTYALASQRGRQACFFALTTNRASRETEERARRAGRFVMHLGPIQRPAVRGLLARALEVPLVSELLEEAVEVRARGNPLFVLRLARWLLACGLVERVAGRATLSLRAAEDLANVLPPDLESLVHAEIDQLPPSVREVLRTVSVLGQEFTPELAATLCEIGGVDPEMAGEAFEQLSRAGLLVTTGGTVRTLRFSRLSDREVIYAGLPAGQRRALHKRVAEVLAARGASIDRLATHYDAADDHPQAARCCAEVAREAFARGAWTDALRLFGAAGRHLAALGEDRTDCDLGEIECLAKLGSYGEARARALSLADRLTDVARRIRALTEAASCATYEGDIDAARAIVRRARAELPTQAPAELRANVLLTCANIYHAMGQPLEALEELAAAGPLAGEESAPVLLATRAGLLAETGQVAAASALAREASSLARGKAHGGDLATVLLSLGRVLELSGETEEARSNYLEAREIYVALQQPANAASALLRAAQVDLREGKADRALGPMQMALEIFRHYQSGQDETAALCGIGRARSLLGDREGAVRDLREAVERSERTLEHHAAIAGRAYLAEALWPEDRPLAERLLDEAAKLGAERQLAAELDEASRIASQLRG